MTPLEKLVAGLALAALFVLAPLRASLGQEKKGPPLPKEVNWKLQALDQAPFKVVSTQYDPKSTSLYWVIELVRDLDVYEDGAYWAPAFKDGRRTRFRFECHDADGIVLKIIEGRYVGEYVSKAGKRFGTLLEVPPEVAQRTKTVEALAK